MIVDFDEVVGGAPEASFDTEGLTPQSLGSDVFESLAPWGVPAEGTDCAGKNERPTDHGPVGFPTPSIFLETIAAHDESNRGLGTGEPEAGQGNDDPESRQTVPVASVLRQIVKEHAAAGGDGAAIAAALERVAERVRRGEIKLPNVSAEGEAAALALALTALLQPGRD